MLTKAYFNFLAELLYSYRIKHLWTLFISALLVMIITSFFFVTASIKRDLFLSLDAQSDFVLQKFRAGNVEDIPNSWMDEWQNIKGVATVTSRVYGQHFYEPLEQYFTIVGVDLSKEKVQKDFQNLFKNINIDDFRSKDNMIMGKGVKALFDHYEYKEYYIFRPPDRSKKKVYFYSEFPKESQIISNDMIVMDINLAREILGIAAEYSTDIAIDLEDDSFFEKVRIALILSHFDMRIIQKQEIKKHYENIFNYKGGVFLALYIISLLTFLLILYQKYSSVKLSEAKEIALLRVFGWRISDVITLKLIENFIVVFMAYIVGVIIAYFYVFYFGAPLVKEIFLGFNNLENSVIFEPFVEISILVMSFFVFVIPYMLVILVPVYKIAITEPVEVMR